MVKYTAYLEGQERLALRRELAEDGEQVGLQQTPQLGLHRGGGGGGAAGSGTLEGLDGLDSFGAEVPPALRRLTVLAPVPHGDGRGGGGSAPMGAAAGWGWAERWECGRGKHCRALEVLRL
jgi:hypothetical protein